MILLKTENLTAHYGDFQALFGVDLAVAEGETVAIIGANGAGKSTFLRCLTGLHPTKGQTIEFDGQAIGGAPGDAIHKAGLAMVPEGRRLFRSLSVEENLMIGTGIRRDRSAVAEDLWEIYNAFPILGERRHANAGALSGGQQQMLVIGRALMTNPKLMMIDEPSLGLAPKIVDQVYDTLLELQALKGLTLLIVEQSSARAARVGGRMILMRGGRIVGDGDAAELGAEDSLRDAYFGQSKPVKEAS